ncbi:6-hydroxymethylpterin diphosphokinase MptE-like protein [Pseudoalteromonas sp.]|uniref:motility associated factor glycosyltransferase family protein n=1 Tax=Pseudoalteromonas sp. TaxID=53249 RepID=UPI003561A4D5
MTNLQNELKDLALQLEQAKDKVERENQFVQLANKRFELNLKTFQKYMPEIYERYLTYQPSEKFDLFLNQNNAANIIDYDSGMPMYGDDPIAQSQKQVEKSILKPEISRVDHSAIEHLKNETNFLHIDLMKALGKEYNKAASSLQENHKVDDVIPSTVIFGIGLGYHIPILFEKFSAKYISIFEPNEDYFFASLFVINWAELLEEINLKQCSLHLGIGVPEDELYEQIYLRAQDLGAFSIAHSYFYQHYPSEEINRLIAELKLNFHQIFMGWGFFDDALLSIAHTCENATKQFSLIDSNYHIGETAKAQPIFIVANGPSLDNDIELIKSFQDEAIIVSCNSASTALINQGITPDFHVALERTKATHDFLSYMLSEEQRQKMNLLVLNVMYPEVLDLFPWTGVALKGSEAGTMMYHISEYIETQNITSTLGYCNPLVGNTALSFFARLGFENIYLFGVDNGYVDPNYHHSKSSYYYNNQGQTIHNPLKMGSEIRVPGNFGGEVITDHFMHTGKEQMERLLREYNNTNLNCFNCSNGTLIEGTIPLNSSDILLTFSDKLNVIQEIKQYSFKEKTPKSLEQYLNFEVFEEICMTMASFLEEPQSTRTDSLNCLLSSLRYLYSFKTNARYAHLYLILEGEALYTSSVLLSMLYNFGDEQSIVPFYKNALKLWITFLKDAPQHYRERWNKLSDYSFDYSKPSIENVDD